MATYIIGRNNSVSAGVVAFYFIFSFVVIMTPHRNMTMVNRYSLTYWAFDTNVVTIDTSLPSEARDNFKFKFNVI